MIDTLLGGISAQQFLSEYWQKKPLLVRQAIPGFGGLISPDEARELAGDEDVEARLIWQQDGQWQMQHGPFKPRQLKRKEPFTFLIQGLNLLDDAADALLRHFSFIPYARLDDVMVSYANDGGSVGPHFDSYDVFLLQGHGQRHWQVSAQSDTRLIEDAPLRILKNFTSEDEWLLSPGDMLYLPPRYAHHGVAMGECMTYSIGFRAPAKQELMREFCSYLQDNICAEGLYADPDLNATAQPAEVPTQMIEQVAAWLNTIRWESADVEKFLGQYLSEPKTHVFFDPPEAPKSAAAFNKASQKCGVALDIRSQLLYKGEQFWLNGELHLPETNDQSVLQQLANTRKLDSLAGLSLIGQKLLYGWYCDGFLMLNQAN